MRTFRYRYFSNQVAELVGGLAAKEEKLNDFLEAIKQEIIRKKF